MGGPRDDDEVRLEHLVLWPGFVGDEWELPQDAVPGERLLVGWKMASRCVDRTPPPAVARLLATVLCGVAALTFPSALRPPVGAALLRRAWRLNRHFVWTTTSNPDDAVQGIFHADYFSWSMRGQVVILSTPGVVIPLTERHLEVHGDGSLFSELARTGALGVLLPGVDGQVAGLYLFTPAFSSAVRDGLCDAALAADATCIVANGENMRSLLRD